MAVIRAHRVRSANHRRIFAGELDVVRKAGRFLAGFSTLDYQRTLARVGVHLIK